MKTVLTTVNELKLRTSIGENIDPELLSPHLQVSQELYVAEILGAPLYDSIVTQYDNNQISGITETLLNEYIVPAIAYSAWFSCYPFLAYRTQRNGLTTTASPDSVSLTPEEMAIYGGRVGNLKDFYLKKLEDYLIENKTSFPLYRQSENLQQGGGSIFLKWKTSRKISNYWDLDRFGHGML